MIVDDEEVLLVVAKVFLERAGNIKVDTAQSAKKALEKLESFSYDVIVADYEMPVMDGITLLKTIRSRGMDIPFGIFTGKGREWVVIEALNYGADFYMKKGGDPKAEFAELLHKIRRTVDVKKTEEKLKNVEETLTFAEHIIDAVRDPLVVVDEDLKVARANNSFFKRFGGNREDIEGDYFFDCIDEEMDVPQFHDWLDEVMLSDSSSGDLEIQYKSSKSGNRFLSLEARQLFTQTTQPNMILLYIADITDQRVSENALRESERLFSDIINFLPDATFAIDVNGQVIAWNKEMEGVTGIKAADIVGKGDYEYAIPFYQKRRPILIDLVMNPSKEIENLYKTIIREGEHVMAETAFVRTDKGEVILWGRAAPLIDENGEVVGAIESIRDITMLKKEQAGNESS